jgi:hypothetical protein
MIATAQVDMSLAKRGDVCHHRDGFVSEFWFVLPVSDSDYTYAVHQGDSWRSVMRRDGRWIGYREDGRDITHVTRNGVQVTPVE